MKWVARRSGLRRGLRARGQTPRAHYAALISILESFTLRGRGAARAPAAARPHEPGHHLHRVRREGGARAHLPLRLRAPHHPRPRSGSGSRPASSSASPRSTSSSPTSTRTRSVSRTRSSPPSSSSPARSTSASCCGVVPPRKIYTHVVGTDIIRDDKGEYLVLEDNCRVPERRVLRAGEPQPRCSRVFPEFFALLPGAPDQGLPDACSSTRCCASAPRSSQNPVAVVLTPGHPQLRLLRALVPRPRDGRGPGGGARPPRRGQPRLHAHHPRQAAGGRHLPAGRRRLPRSPRPSAATACSACPG